jgi:hypothetical protein
LTLPGGLTLTDGAILDFDLGAVSDRVRITGGTVAGAGRGGVEVRVHEAGGLCGGRYVLMDWTGAAATGVEESDFDVVMPPGSTAFTMLTIENSQLVLSIHRGMILRVR